MFLYVQGNPMLPCWCVIVCYQLTRCDAVPMCTDKKCILYSLNLFFYGNLFFFPRTFLENVCLTSEKLFWQVICMWSKPINAYILKIYILLYGIIRLKNKAYVSTFKGVNSVCVDKQPSVLLQTHLDAHFYMLLQNYDD